MTHVYVKSMIWAGKTKFYVGHQPSDPTADPCNRLGAYFIETENHGSAMAIAAAEARRLGCSVVECPCFVGFSMAPKIFGDGGGARQ